LVVRIVGSKQWGESLFSRTIFPIGGIKRESVHLLTGDDQSSIGLSTNAKCN
jgi:hypothetical protein